MHTTVCTTFRMITRALRSRGTSLVTEAHNAFQELHARSSTAAAPVSSRYTTSHTAHQSRPCFYFHLSPFVSLSARVRRRVRPRYNGAAMLIIDNETADNKSLSTIWRAILISFEPSMHAGRVQAATTREQVVQRPASEEVTDLQARRSFVRSFVAVCRQQLCPRLGLRQSPTRSSARPPNHGRSDCV